jgi:hypothetical protein
MWYFPLLKPYHDHVPVKADLSDLGEKIKWCRENDDKCREIAENAKKFYDKYVAESPLLDYLEMITKHIAKRFVKPPYWWEPPPPEQDPPQLRKPDVPCYENRRDSRKSRLCTRCQEDLDAEVRELEESQAQMANAVDDAKTKKRRFHELRKRRAQLKAKNSKSE